MEDVRLGGIAVSGVARFLWVLEIAHRMSSKIYISHFK